MNNRHHRAERICACIAAISTTFLLASCGGGSDDETLSPAPDRAPNPSLTPAHGSVFVPAADDLPLPSGTYVYPEPSVTTMAVTYVPTPVSGPGNYINRDGICSEQSSPPEDTYPGGMVTLHTVNLNVIKSESCKPEIKVLTSIDQLNKASAKLRQRGGDFRGSAQKSYRIKLDDTDWHGETTFQLNKHPLDLARVRNKLSFDLMRDVPHQPSLRTQFVNMTYTDENGATSNMGLYTHVENMGKRYLEHRGWLANSNVYKAEFFEFYEDSRLAVNSDGTPGPEFEKVLSIESDSKDHTAVAKMLAELNAENADFPAVFDRHFNKNNYLAWFSTVLLLGNYDTDTHNFGLYQPLGTERFYFLPWDYDGALGYPQQPDVQNYPNWYLGVGLWWNNPLHQGFLRQPGNTELLRSAVLEIRQKYLTDANIKAKLDAYRRLVEPIITSSPDVKQLTLDQAEKRSAAEQWAVEYERIAQSIETNLQHFLNSLEGPMPSWLDVSTNASGQTILDWGYPRPFHPKGKPIHYSLEVAKLVAGKAPFSADTIVLSESNIKDTEKTVTLPHGTYVMRVVASDDDGHQAQGLDVYFQSKVLYPGTLCVSIPSGNQCTLAKDAPIGMQIRRHRPQIH